MISYFWTLDSPEIVKYGIDQVDDDIDAMITRLTEDTYAGDGPVESNV